MWFIGLAGGYGNDSEIIPLNEAVSISPTYALLEMGTGQQTERQWGDRAQAERIPSLPHRLSVHKRGRVFVFQFLHTVK